jgi:hypothetical protein
MDDLELRSVQRVGQEEGYMQMVNDGTMGERIARHFKIDIDSSSS